MNIEQLMYIVEVANTKSLAKAAKTLNISQSAISQAISKLESELNLKIFDRSKTGVFATKEGEKIIEKAQFALHGIYQIKEEAFNQINKTNDLLRISTIPGLIGPIIDTYLSFKNSKSSLKIEVNEKASMEIVEDIKKGKVDIGFIAINKEKIDYISDLHFTPIMKGKLLVFASTESPLADNKTVINTDLLKQQIFVLYKDEFVQEFIHHFQRLFGPIDIFFTTTNLEVINKAVTELGAVTLGHDISALFNNSFPSNKMIALDIVDFIDTSFRFGWIKKNDYKLSHDANLYINEVNKYLLEHRNM